MVLKVISQSNSKFLGLGTSLVAQWLRLCLPMQGTWVQALVGEDPTCCEATKPVSHNYWDRPPQLLKARTPRARAPQHREATVMRSPHATTKSIPRSPKLEKARAQQRTPNADKNKINLLKKKIFQDLVIGRAVRGGIRWQADMQLGNLFKKEGNIRETAGLRGKIIISVWEMLSCMCSWDTQMDKLLAWMVRLELRKFWR